MDFNKIEKLVAQEVSIQRYDFSTSRRTTLDQRHDARGDRFHHILNFVDVAHRLVLTFPLFSAKRDCATRRVVEQRPDAEDVRAAARAAHACALLLP
jgi:hypothetical protein